MRLTRVDVFLGILAGVFLGVAAGLAFLLSRKFPDMKERPFDTAKKWMENSWLAGLPSTNFKILTTVVLYFLTFGAWALATLLGKEIDNMAFGMWLGFLAGLGGFALAQFNKQRESDYGLIERKTALELAKAGGPPATQINTTGDVKAGGPTTIVDGDGSSAPAPAPTPPPPAANP